VRKLFRSFIDWKNNIKFVPMYELNAVFKDSNLIENFRNEFGNIQSLIEDSILKEHLKSTELKSEPFDFGAHFHGQKFWTECEPLIGNSPYHRSISFQSIVRENHGSNNSSINCKVEDYPNLLIQFTLKKFYSNLFILSVSNTSLRSWDTNTHPNNYKYINGIKFYIDPVSRSKKVDISDRPGRPASLSNFYFRGAHEYWFGENAYEYFSKRRILDFRNASIVEELENRITHVKLFEMEQYWEVFAQERLAEFRKHLNIDELENQYFKKYNFR
jgi:hypothetical protein